MTINKKIAADPYHVCIMRKGETCRECGRTKEQRDSAKLIQKAFFVKPPKDILKQRQNLKGKQKDVFAEFKTHYDEVMA